LAESVKYRPGGDNAVLKAVLYDLWDFKCYWCGGPKEFGDVSIDHIVPQSFAGEKLLELRKKHGLPTDFDLHDPMNLAPICTRCNGPSGKGGRDLLTLPIVGEKLLKARGLRPRVVKQVAEFATSGKVAKALLQARTANLKNEKIRAAFETYAPAVVQQLALLGESLAQQFTAERTYEIDLGDGIFMSLEVALDEAARRALTILEDVCQDDLDDLLQVPILEVRNRMLYDVESEFRRIEDPAGGETDAGTPEIDFLNIRIDSIEFRREASDCVFAFEGHLESSMSSSLVQNSADGGETVEIQGDAYVTGQFQFEAVWDCTEGGRAEVGNTRGEFEIEVSPPKSREMEPDFDYGH
jgi:hypothetical protein